KIPIDVINLESSEQKKNLIQLLILVYSILLGLSAHLFDLLKVSERTFYGLAITFLFYAILYYIIIQKEESYNKMKDIKYYLFILFIFGISFLISLSFSLFLTAFFLIATTPESTAVPMNTVINTYTNLTFVMLAALMKKDKWTIVLFYILMIIFYFWFSYNLNSLHH
ncbi:MAG: hypothetical protein O8C62_09055, partial [Candidatus Methanoperedens sp.]|nr:hypothetical protein [Candidatus Methanoperedens sp.]